MARQALRNYVFNPAGAGVGNVQIPGNFAGGQILTVLDTTAQQFIYNFADNTLQATITWSPVPNNNFPTSIDGITTITFTTSTSTLSSTDKLAIYAEVPYVQERPFARDAVERLRVANPQSLIDADFEYGLQNTKWQSLFVNNDNPSIYEVPGSDVYANTISYVGFLGNAITSSVQNTVIISNGSSAGNNQPNWLLNDFAVTWNPHVANPPQTGYVTANVASQNQRALTMNSTTGFSQGQNVILVYAPNVAASTCTVNATVTAGNTTIQITGANSIVNGSMLSIQTANVNVFELVSVQSGGGTGTLTVARNRLNSNSGNAAMGVGNVVSIVGQVEVANVISIDSSTQMSVNRGWMNTVAQDGMNAGTIVQAINWDSSTTSGGNTEIIQTTIISNAAGNVATIARGALGTTAASTYQAGSPVIRLSGIFVSGNVGISQVTVNLPGHGFSQYQPISTTNHNIARTEGQYQIVSPVYSNYLNYFPKATTGLNIGYPLNRWDTVIRYGGFYGTASLPALTFTSDGANPSTITATSAYAHGLSPGTPILANVVAASNSVGAFGPFTILTIPSTNTFTFQAKTGYPVTGPVTGAVYVRPSAFFVHRAADGGVNLGTGTPHHGASAARQTKKYFRYQSGKGLMWTSGTLLGANMDIIAATAGGTGVGNVMTVTTYQEHQLQIGANIQISGITTSGYNGYYLVTGVNSDTQFTVNTASVLGSIPAVFGNQPKVISVSWIGASVRAGLFDDQNGVFWENTGTQINVVLRAAVYYMTGTVSVETATNLCTGDGTCQFLTQFVAGDKIILRGMTHTVTSVIDNNTLTISPVWRGLTNQVRIQPSKVLELRYPQSQWNIDRLDGTGPSGYKLDPTKMQMLMIQYTWYGAGFIDFGVRGPLGNYVFCHRIMNNNSNYQAYMRSGNLPARYQAINDTPYQILNSNSSALNYTGITASDTTFTIIDATQFPTPSPASPVYVLIDNEIMKCTGITLGTTVGNVTPATVTGVTRAATFNLFQDSANKSFSAGSASSHQANVSVRVISATNAPSLNHWGSAVILDGGFDTDRGYAYTYSVANVAFPTGLAAGNTTITAFAMRLAPSVSNQIPGQLGTRDLVNRAQLILQNMIINFSGANISTTTGARYLVEGILNPNNISTTTTTFNFLFNSPYNASSNPSSAVQPSYTQVAPGNITGTSSSIAYTSVTQFATGGERLFAIPVNYTNSGQLDLSSVKQLGNSGIPGYNIYPDGPELLAINITALVPTPGVNASGEIQIQWNESQA